MSSFADGWKVLMAFIAAIGWFFRQEFTQNAHGKALKKHETRLDIIYSIDRRLSRIEGRLGVHKDE